ncbi:MAG: hypothetical protein ACI97A_001179 [Planctomycetota bacterium]
MQGYWLALFGTSVQMGCGGRCGPQKMIQNYSDCPLTRSNQRHHSVFIGEPLILLGEEEGAWGILVIQNPTKHVAIESKAKKCSLALPISDIFRAR